MKGSYCFPNAPTDSNTFTVSRNGMTKTRNYFRWTVWTITTFVVLFITGLFAGLPLIPWVETDYFVKGTNESLAHGVKLKQIDNAIVKIEIPNYFSQNEQSIDTWFASSDSSYTLTIDNFSFEAASRGNNSLKKENSYLFWDNGSKENDFRIQNYSVTKSNSQLDDKYVFLRSVYDLGNVKELVATIKLDVQINGKPENIEQSLPLVKKQKLTWNKFRVH